MTSDEQRERAAFEASEPVQEHTGFGLFPERLRWLPEIEDYNDYAMGFMWKSWQACAAQQAPQARADEGQLWSAARAAILNAQPLPNEGYEEWSARVDAWANNIVQTCCAALAANPQQSNESDDNQLRREVAARSPAVNGPGSAPASLSPNPQIASEPKEQANGNV